MLHSWKSSAATLNIGFDDRVEWVHVDITLKGKFRYSWFSRLENLQDPLRKAVEADIAVDDEDMSLEWVWGSPDKQGES